MNQVSAGQTLVAQTVFDSCELNRRCGAPIGILLLDYNYRPVPGGPRENPSSSASPYLCRIVPGCTVDRLVYKGDDGLQDLVITAARELVNEGARAIASNCGFMIRHQQAVRNAVDVPVLLSSLLVAPLLLACLGSSKKLAVLTASGPTLTAELLERAGVSDAGRLVVGDVGSQPVFRQAVMEASEVVGMPERTSYEAEIERETVGVASSLILQHPDIAAILLECTGLSQYAPAVHRAANLPVFDVASMIEFFADAFATPGLGRLTVDGKGIGLAVSVRRQT
ncbi:hypothetical protein [Bradyrhizobium sp. 162]|uniref:hypothetical protein n=1 Tax=Bradyrhizobium sp. 162 TaxID=2782635 RepID=UPI001FFBF966|nr:hypothetical protein [Bradyrhizobium sp. 162]MCK1632632.1 hypothetical protein [Bradyrhizobium sp. 162]